MPESKAHKRLKRREAGRSGRTEVPLRGGKSRLDVAMKRRAKEIERSGSLERLKEAAKRLKMSGKPQKVLIVPQKDMSKAARAMRDVGVNGTVKNLRGTKRRWVKGK